MEDDFEAKFKKVAINFNDFEDDFGDDDSSDDDPELILGMDLVLTNGQHMSFAKQFSQHSLNDHLLLQPDEQADFEQALRWISILSLAGARTFSQSLKLVAPAADSSDAEF